VALNSVVAPQKQLHCRYRATFEDVYIQYLAACLVLQQESSICASSPKFIYLVARLARQWMSPGAFVSAVEEARGDEPVFSRNKGLKEANESNEPAHL